MNSRRDGYSSKYLSVFDSAFLGNQLTTQKPYSTDQRTSTVSPQHLAIPSTDTRRRSMSKQKKCSYCSFETDQNQAVCPKCGWKMGWTPKGENKAATTHLRAAILFVITGITMAFWAPFTQSPPGLPPWLHPLLLGGILSIVIGFFLYRMAKNA